MKSGKEKALAKAIQAGTLRQGSIAGDEYLDDMEHARLQKDGTAVWVEVCYCPTPLQEERPYWEEFFQLLEVKDAHSRRNCRHENGTEPWACSSIVHRAPVKRSKHAESRLSTGCSAKMVTDNGDLIS
jgi:hypothetical protein